MILATIKNPNGSGMRHFDRSKPVEILGKLSERERGLHDIYLAKKTKNVDGSWGSSWAAIRHTSQELLEGIGKYEPYNGFPLSTYSENEKEYMWLEERDIEFTPSILAKISLERWDE